MKRLFATAPILLVLAATWGGTCAPGTIPDTIPATNEQEPNNFLDTAQVVDVSSDTVRIVGSIGANDDTDLFSLGALKRGDRVTVTLDGAATDAQVSVALFDVQSDLGTATLAQSAVAGAGTGFSGAVLDALIRKDGTYHVGTVRRFGNIEPGTNYDFTVHVQHSLAIPGPVAQVVMLKFGGGTFIAPDGNTVTVGPCDPGVLSASLGAGRPLVLDFIAATTRTNFNGYGVQILRDDQDAAPTDKPFSTVFIGPVLSGEGSLASDGLGVTVRGVDADNQNRSDVAVVFPQLFTPEFLGVAGLTPEQLGVALGNVTSHEIGHLLGLQHTFDPTDVMNTFDSPATLLQEQRFKRAVVHFFVFDPLQTYLAQDAPRSFQNLVGWTRRTPDLTLTAEDTPFSLTAADFNLDGGLDLAAANLESSSVSLFLNLGNSSFSEAIPLTVEGKPIDVVAFDADANGLVDLITANPPAQNLAALYLGNDGFTFPYHYTAGDRPRKIAVGRFDANSSLDMAVANYVSNDVSILLNDGFGSFSLGSTVTVGTNPQGIVAADLDGDGKTDLAVSNYNGNTVTILKGAGNGTFSTLATLPCGSLPFGITAADLNKDGKVDLAVTSFLSAYAQALYASSVSVLINQGAGKFAPQAIYPVEPGAEGIAAADLDRDGNIDLITTNSGEPSVIGEDGSVSVLMNRGNGTFAQDVVWLTDRVPSGVVVGDLDGVGGPDVAISDRVAGTVSIFFNE